MKVLVTGANGFVASAVVRHLLAANYEVRAIVRHKHNLSLLDRLDLEKIEGDITDFDSVEKAARGCPIVIHLASIYSFYPFWERKAETIYKVNVQGTTNVLNAALKNKVEKFIYTSTIATIGKRPDGKPSNEDTPFNPKGASHYARSKYLAEQEVLKFCQKGLPAVILNPAIIIGERDYKPTPSGEAIVKFLNRSYPGYFETTWPVADVDDVARAHLAAIKQERVGERYILCNKKHYTLKEIFDLLEEISGIKSPRIKIPYPLLSAFVHIEELLSYGLLKKKPLMPTEGVKFCRMSTTYNNSKASTELGYVSTPFKETLTKAINWYRMNGYIEPRGIFRLKANGSEKIKFFMKKTGIGTFTDKLTFGTIVLFIIVKILQLAERAGLKPSEDGWRKTTRCYLRTEHSKFSLAVFRLDLWSGVKSPGNITLDATKEHIVKRLASFLNKYPSLHWQLKWHRFSAQREESFYCDIVVAEFDNSGALKKIKPSFDAELAPEVSDALLDDIVSAYNKTRKLRDKKRPLALDRLLNKKCLRYQDPNKAKDFISRVLSATFLSFEIITDIAKRYYTPAFIKFKHPGFGFLNILCRLTGDCSQADFWFQFSHIPEDGVPMQEVLNDLKKCWGTCQEVPAPTVNHEKRKIAELCSTDNHKHGIYHLDDFVDFLPLLKFKRKLNRELASKASGSITLVALFIWKLAHYPIFDDIKFAVPVDLKATNGRERTLGFIFIRPSIYFDQNKPDGGFLEFQQDFNLQLHKTRERKSASYTLLEYYALTAPVMYAFTKKFLCVPLCDFTGTVGITVIKEADLFIAPSSDVHTDGFIAISNLSASYKDGNIISNVSIKAPKDKIDEYLKTIKEVATLQN